MRHTPDARGYSIRRAIRSYIMSNYDEWFKKGYELLQIAEEVIKANTMLVSPDGKRAIYFPFPFHEKEIQSEIDQLRQQLETEKQKHEAREKQK